MSVNRQGDKAGQKATGKRRSTSKRIRDAEILKMRMSGMNTQEIADKVGLGRQRVSEILNSEDVERVARQIELGVAGLAQDSLERLEKVIKQDLDIPSSLRASLAVLKSIGAIREKSEVAVTLPKPTIIKRKDGTEVVMGATLSRNEEDEE